MSNTILERLTRLETKVEEIISNHIAHLDAKVDRLQWLLVTSLIGIITILLTVILKK